MLRSTLTFLLIACFTIVYGQNFNAVLSDFDQGEGRTQGPRLAHKANAPFLHGVASGDPLQDRVIIWTRLTTENVSEAEVSWIMTSDADLMNVVQSGTFTTNADRDWTVKVDVDGLAAGTTYYYRFSYDNNNSYTGRTRTAAATDDHVRFGVVSCSNYQAGYFNVYRNLSLRADLDAIIHLGDYIYEYEEGGYGWDTLLMRGHDPDHEILTLMDYRTRYGFYKLDPDLQAAHQQHAFVMIWDDHESANDAWVDGAQNHDPDTEGSWEDRKAVAKQAYFEWNPIRDYADQKIYRTLDYGSLANLILLDTRLEGRDEQVTSSSDPEYSNPDRTLLGAEQLQWFKDELTTNTSTWSIVANQVIFAAIDIGTLISIEGAETAFLDVWDGYPAERDSLIAFVRDNNLDNVVILTGDFHTALAYDIPTDIKDTVAYNPETGMGSHFVEMAVPSVTSANFDENLGTLWNLVNDLFPTFNAHLKYMNLIDHGYCVLDVKSNAATADYFFTEDIKKITQNEIHGYSLEAVSGSNFWNPVAEPSVGKPNPPALAPGGPPVNVQEIEQTVQVLALYPNPAANVAMLNMSVAKAGNLNIEIFNVIGENMGTAVNRNVTPGNYSLSMDISSLDKGIYYLKINSNDGLLTVPLVVKR